jgi:cell division protein FtsB
MGRPLQKSKLVKTLRRLQRELNTLLRSQLIEMGCKALLNWFAIEAWNLLRGVPSVNKVTLQFIHSHLQELSTIANKNAERERKQAILK